MHETETVASLTENLDLNGHHRHTGGECLFLPWRAPETPHSRSPLPLPYFSFVCGPCPPKRALWITGKPCHIHRCHAAESIWGETPSVPSKRVLTVFCSLKWGTLVLAQCPRGIWCPRSPVGDLGCTGGCGHCRDATRASLDCSPGFHQHRAVTGHLYTMNLEVRTLCKGK